jgi:hypothetical protein
VAPPAKGAIASLKVAVTAVMFTGTPVTYTPGVSAVTAGLTTAISPVPRMGSRSAPHPANKALDSAAASHSKHSVYLLNWSTISPIGFFRSRTVGLQALIVVVGYDEALQK